MSALSDKLQAKLPPEDWQDVQALLLEQKREHELPERQKRILALKKALEKLEAAEVKATALRSK